MAVGATIENYLEHIHMLSMEKDKVRQRDVCASMGYSRPTVSVTLRSMRDEGYLDIGEDSSITLTKKGKKIAESTYERHCVISAMLISLGVDEETADEDACRIEHDMSQKSFDAVKAHYEKWKK